jgi:hypothetical protein
MSMKTRISEKVDCEAVLAYEIEPGKDRKRSFMFVFRGTVEECEQMFEGLCQKTALVTGPEDDLEERPAKLVILDAKEKFQNN